MSIRIRDNISGIYNRPGSQNMKKQSNTSAAEIGKVYGVITTENTPTKELFEKHGGWGAIGTVFYITYNQAKDVTINYFTLCIIARPIHASNHNYPLLG